MLRVVGDINTNVGKTDKIPVLLCSIMCIKGDVRQTINNK